MAKNITVNVVADVSKFKSGLGTANSELGKFGSASSKAQGMLGKTTKVLGTGLLAAGAGVTALAASSIKLASDAQQSVGATETVFGKFAKNVISDSNGAAKAFGLSANEYRENANLIGSLFKNQGVSTDQLAGKTKSMIGTASDLAATFGGTTKDAVEALGSAFKGEFDPLEKYGISIKQSTVNTEAMRLANVKTTAEFNKLSLAQQTAFKQQATASLVQKQSASSQGAFAKETGTLAHQQQVLAAQFDNVRAKLGSALLPILTSVMQTISKEFLPMLDQFSKWFAKEGPKAIDGLVSGFKTLLPIVAQVAKFFAEHAKTIAILVGVFYAVTAAVAAYNAVIGAYAVISKVITAATIVWRNAQLALNIAMMLNPIGLIVIAIIALIAVFVLAWKNSETFRDIIIGAWNLIKAAASAVWGFIKNIIAGFIDWISGAASAVIHGFTNLIVGGWNLIKNVTTTVWNFIKNHIKTIMLAILVIVTGPIGLLVALIIKNWGAIKNATSAAWNAVKSVVSSVVNGIKTVVTSVIGAVKTFISGVWTSIKNTAVTMWNNIKTAVSDGVRKTVDAVKGIKDKILGFFKGAGTWLLQIGKDIVMGLINGLGNMLGKLKDKVGEIGSAVKDGVSGLLKIGSPSKVMEEIGKWTVQGLANGLQDRSALKQVSLASANMLGSISGEVTFDAKASRTIDTSGGAAFAGGNTYNITLQATPGTNGAALGKQLVETIKEYEGQAGTGWRN